MKRRNLENTLLYLYPFLGIVLICLLSFWQRCFFGADYTSLMGYVIPSFVGLIGGSAVSASGYWNRKAFLHEREKRAQIVELNKQHEEFIQTLSEGVCTVDKAGKCLYVNHAALGILDCEEHELLGENLLNLIAPDLSEFERALKKHQVTSLEKQRLYRVDGTEILASVTIYPSPGATIVAFNELSSEAFLKNKINFLHTHDPLCAVLNKEAWRKRVEEIFNQKVVNPDSCNSLFVVDIDRFKVINETISYAAGDHYLKDFAQYLVFKIGSTENISRSAGDEFSFMLLGRSSDEAKKVAEELIEDLSSFETYWNGKLIKSSVSIGGCVIDERLTSFDNVLQGAGAACRAAKEAGRAQVRFYDPDLSEYKELQKQLDSIAPIQGALEHDRFFLRGQSIAAITGNDEPSGMEILISMLDESGSVVFPDQFIPAAEKFDLMPDIDRWVIRNAIQWLENNAAFCKKHDFISINLSGKTFSHDGFADFLISVIKETTIAPYKLCFEITETAAVNSRLETIAFVEQIKELGCRFALDDFGTGMSSFEYLKSFPVDFIKIDGSFICDIENDEISQEIVRSIQRIGKKLHVKIIAEHSETDASLKLLQDMGIDFVQGYIIDKPSPLVGTQLNKS